MDKYNYFDKTEKLTNTRGENLWRCNYKENGVAVCNYEITIGERLRVFNHFGDHLKIRHPCNHCHKEYGLTGLREHYMY